MKLVSMEPIGDSEVFFKAVVEETTGFLMFKRTKTTTYVGNYIDWIDQASGYSASSKKLKMFLDSALRLKFVNDLIKEGQKPNLSVIKKGD